MIQDRDRVTENMLKDAKNRVSLARFARIVEAYGAEAERWPEAEREAALALIRAEPKAKARLAAASRLDRALAALPQPVPADAAFLKRLATVPHAATPAPASRAAPRWAGTFAAALGFRTLVPQGLALAAAGLIGVWLGLSLNVPNGGTAIEMNDTAYFAFNPDLEKDLEEFR